MFILTVYSVSLFYESPCQLNDVLFCCLNFCDKQVPSSAIQVPFLCHVCESKVPMSVLSCLTLSFSKQFFFYILG